MKTQAEVMETLSDLSDADRVWIIDRLSPKARASLLSVDTPISVALASKGGSVGTSGSTTSSISSVVSNGVPEWLAAADPAQVVSVLECEPAWVTHAILSRSWSGSQRLLNLLSASTKSEVESLQSSAIEYSPKVIDVAMQALKNTLSLEFVPPKRRRFDALIADIGAKFANKRLRIGE